MRIPISIIILTYNEEIHIELLLKNISDWADEIFIVDSYSTDKTLEIAKKYDAKIFQHKFENQARQFNWALDNLKIKNEWILRLDADEYLTEELKKEIIEVIPKTALEISGFYIKRRVYFMGRWIKHGGYYPFWFLRLFRKGKARSEQREMDEHLVLLEGKSGKLENDFVDDNKKDLTWWTEKHNNYASREVAAILVGDFGISKKKFYYKLPMFFRVYAYFCYRYFLRLGFLDGKEGLIFHFLHAFWYRFLIDAKIYEKK
ncbi:MAG: glycosyltransferase family 2 protein [Patescibacteria group bacterium]